MEEDQRIQGIQRKVLHRAFELSLSLSSHFVRKVSHMFSVLVLASRPHSLARCRVLSLLAECTDQLDSQHSQITCVDSHSLLKFF